jgi:hypothetical protein
MAYQRAVQSRFLYLLLISLYIALLSQPAVARNSPSQDIAQVTREKVIAFGLVGKWSYACNVWYRGFEAPKWYGFPTIYEVLGGEVTERAEIVKAQVINSQTFKIWYDYGFGMQTMTIKKEGSGIRTIAQEIYGKTIIENDHFTGKADNPSFFTRCK